MTQTCPQCRTKHDATARFCADCGASLAATSVGGRTVVMNPITRALRTGLGVDTQAIVDRVRTALQSTRAAPAAAIVPHVAGDQREELYLTNDRSGSMAEDFDSGTAKIQAAIRASVNLVANKHRIDPLDRIGIIAFTNTAEVLLRPCQVGENKAPILQILQGLTPGGGTDINSALIAARDHFNWAAHGLVRRLVLLTDGHGGRPLKTAEDLKNRGVVIDVIGIGPEPSAVNEKLLRQVASVIEGQTRYRFIRDSRTLVTHYTQLAGKTSTCS